MSLKRIFAAGFISFAMVISAFTYSAPVRAENDTTSAPVLHEAEAKNTGGTSAKEAGDTIVLEFSETTNKFAITASNVMTEFHLNNSHTFLDGAGAIGDAEWSVDGEKLTIVLSAGVSLPTVAAGDMVTVTGTNIKDLSGAVITGDAVIDGSFSSTDDNNEAECSSVQASRDGDDDDVDEDIDGDEDNDIGEDDDADMDDEQEDCADDADSDFSHHICGSGLQNGMLYRVEGSPTVYLLHDCRLKPFRGIAAFNSRGHKFEDVRTISSVPANQVVSGEPVVPAEGTLIKGSDATVWFVSKSGKRKGFTSAQIFLGLGFKFTQVDQISDSDLTTIAPDTDLIDDSGHHPDGTLIKCANSAAVFEVVDDIRFPFANAETFRGHGHDFDHILDVDCGRFAYQEGSAVTQ